MYSAIATWTVKMVRSPFSTFSINDLRLKDATALRNDEPKKSLKG
ncbi:hypothetical protein [Microcoleus sp. S13_C5]